MKIRTTRLSLSAVRTFHKGIFENTSIQRCPWLFENTCTCNYSCSDVQKFEYLNIHCFEHGKVYPVVYTEDANTREVKRLSVKSKLSTGPLILQTSRAKFNNTEVSGQYVLHLCHERSETLGHFLLD